MHDRGQGVHGGRSQLVLRAVADHDLRKRRQRRRRVLLQLRDAAARRRHGAQQRQRRGYDLRRQPIDLRDQRAERRAGRQREDLQSCRSNLRGKDIKLVSIESAQKAFESWSDEGRRMYGLLYFFGRNASVRTPV